MHDLKKLVNELEDKAKKEKNYEKKANYFQKAAKIWRKIGSDQNCNWERNWKWNIANYYDAIGHYHYSNREYKKAIKCLKIGEKLFLEMKLLKLAFYCATTYLKAQNIDERSKIATNSSLESRVLYLQKYDEFSHEKGYIRREHEYWNAKGKLFKKEMRFKEAAVCYKKSSEIISKINKNRSMSFLETHYKCKAMDNKNDKEIFEKFINKAIELSERRNNEIQIHYHIGLKYEIFGLLATQLEKKINYFKLSKENYYQAKETPSARRAESLYFFSLSQKALENGTYEEAIHLLNETIKIVKDERYPSNLPFPSNLESEKYLYKSYSYLSKGEFFHAIDALDKWLNLNEEIKNTKEYVSNEKIKMCLEFFNKENLTTKDLYEMENIIEHIGKQELGSKIHSICSLTYTYISLYLHNIEEEHILKTIQLEVIKNITTEKIADNLKWLLDIKNTFEESNWIYRLPPNLANKYDKASYMIKDALPDCKSICIRDFYTLLENYLRIIVFFNAQVLWKEEWHSKITEHISVNKKSPEKFAMGDFIQLLSFFKNSSVEFCEKIPDEIFELLKKHVSIRNKLAHDLSNESLENNILEEISKIIIILFASFPTFVTVLNSQKHPWYDVEVVWNHFPKRITLYSKEQLKKDKYFIEPTWDVKHKKIYPRIITPVPPIESIENLFIKK